MNFKNENFCELKILFTTHQSTLGFFYQVFYIKDLSIEEVFKKAKTCTKYSTPKMYSKNKISFNCSAKPMKWNSKNILFCLTSLKYYFSYILQVTLADPNLRDRKYHFLKVNKIKVMQGPWYKTELTKMSNQQR